MPLKWKFAAWSVCFVYPLVTKASMDTQCPESFAKVVTEVTGQGMAERYLVRVTRHTEGELSQKEYRRTNRGLRQLTEPDSTGKILYPRRVFEQMSGRRVLDVGCGGGQLVEDLRDKVDILGLDIHLSDQQKQKPYFIEGDALKMPFADGEFDYLLFSWTVFAYEDEAFQIQALKEARRILRPGGTLLIAPVWKRIRQTVGQVPGLSMVPTNEKEQGYRFVEVRKEP